MSRIELFGNPHAEQEASYIEMEKQRAGIKSFWEWELEIIEQEEAHLKNSLDDLDEQIVELKLKIDQDVETKNITSKEAEK